MNVPEARARFGSTIDRLGELLREADPLADAVVESFAKLPLPGAGRRMLEEALRKGIGAVSGAPEPLRALFAEVDHVPAWVDRDAIERGGELLFRAGWFGGLALGTSLVYGYASPGGNKPLVFSGRLTEQAARRLLETSRFVEATCLPGGLRRYAEGFAITVKVRIMHAQVRRLILQSGRWNTEDWGVPANQHDMAGTSLLFSAVVLDTLRKLGFEPEPEEVHLFMQLWRYSGYLIGVHPEVLPTSEREARRLMEILACTMSEPDDDSRRLTRALFDAREDDHIEAARGRRLAGERQAKLVVKMGQGMIRGVLGQALADQLAVPDHRYKHLFPVVHAMVHGLEGALQALPAAIRARARARAVESGRQYWALLTKGLREPFGFAPPEQLVGLASSVAAVLPRRVSPLAAAARSR
jgi:hypothetical protein